MFYLLILQLNIWIDSNSAGYALPKFAQLSVTSYYSASSASHYGISLLTRHVEEVHTSRTHQEKLRWCVAHICRFYFDTISPQYHKQRAVLGLISLPLFYVFFCLSGGLALRAIAITRAQCNFISIFFVLLGFQQVLAWKFYIKNPMAKITYKAFDLQPAMVY